MDSNFNKELKKLADQDFVNSYEMIASLRKLLDRIEYANTKIEEPKDFSDLYNSNLERLKSPKDPDYVILSGYKDFDRFFGGFIPGELVIVGARPAMGKTQLLINLALNVSNNHPTLFCSFELSDFMLSNRFISTLCGISIGKLLQHDIAEHELSLIELKKKELEDKKLFISDTFGGSITGFSRYCKEQTEQKGLKIIFVDYLQMMGANKSRFGREREIEISRLCRELKKIAKENNVCVIASSQLSRSVETRSGDKRPVLSDLRDSGAIEQDADKVIFVHRPDYYGFTEDFDGNSLKGLVEMILSKNRNGKLGSVWLKRNAEQTSFIDGLNYLENFEFNQIRLNEIDKDSDIESPF